MVARVGCTAHQPMMLEYSDIGEGGQRDVEEALGAAWRGAGPRTLTNLRRSLQPDMIMR